MFEAQERERERLVEAIEQAVGHPLAQRLRQAFLTVARSHFVPVYYVQDNPGEWSRHDAADIVYQDQVLVTKVNEKGHPCSSSSMPSIMAAMLEALDVQEGHRVLEVGTGTGYNAALLGALVGPCGQVVSVDIDHELVVQASARLAEAGYSWVQTVGADGLEGYPSAAPYDRIIITGGYSRLPGTCATSLFMRAFWWGTS